MTKDIAEQLHQQILIVEAAVGLDEDDDDEDDESDDDSNGDKGMEEMTMARQIVRAAAFLPPLRRHWND